MSIVFVIYINKNIYLLLSLSPNEFIAVFPQKIKIGRLQIVANLQKFDCFVHRAKLCTLQLQVRVICLKLQRGCLARIVSSFLHIFFSLSIFVFLESCESKNYPRASFSENVFYLLLLNRITVYINTNNNQLFKT